MSSDFDTPDHPTAQPAGAPVRPGPGAQRPERRATVERFLREHWPMLGSLYSYGGKLLDDRSPDGWQHLVAHVGRELMNRLADHLAEVPRGDPESAPSSTRPQEIGQRLANALAKDEAGLRDEAQALVDQIEAGTDQVRQRAAALLAQAEQEHELDEGARNAWVQAWHALQQRFAGWAHVPGLSVPVVPPERLAAAWQELTDLLATRVALEPFFQSLDELLEIARRPEPDRNTARAALARLRLGTKARFYAELDDPAWVKHLHQLGMFNAPPAAIREGETIRFPEWPEGYVLMAFAARAPEEVLRAAAAVPDSDNGRVAQFLAMVASELPADRVADVGLANRVVKDLQGPARLFDVADPAGRLAARLAQAGRVNKALELLKALLRFEVRVTPSGADFVPDWRHGEFRHEEFLVDQAARAMLPDLVAGDARATVGALVRVMSNAQRQLAHEDSTRWRDAIAGTHSPYGNDPQHLILELLREAAASLARASDEDRAWLLQLLEDQESEIFARLELHLLIEMPDQSGARAAALESRDVLFSRARLADVYALLPVVYAESDAAGQEALLARIEEGPDPSRYGLPTEQLARLADEVAAWQDEARQRLLSALEPRLGPTASARLAELRDQHGTIDRPDFAGVRSTGWVGPTSPLSATQLADLNPDELVAHLRDFRAEGHAAVPTPEGLGRELSAAVKKDPAGWLWLADRLGEVAPMYVRSWLSGLSDALREGTTMADGATLLAALAWVLDQPRDADAERHPFEPDSDFYGATLAAADLAIELLTSQSLALEQREAAWALIERLLDDADPRPDREVRTEAEPLSLSFTALRARGAVALLRYLQWLDATLPAGEGPGPQGFDAVPETQEPLRRLLEDDPSRAVRAALAAELPLLVMVEKSWVSERAAAAVHPEGGRLAQVGWTTYVKYAPLYADVAELLAEPYRCAVAALPGSADSEERRELADHVALLWRDLPAVIPDLLDELLRHGEDRDRARVMSILGRALQPDNQHGYEATEDDIERHRQVWQSRIDDSPGPDELREFGWWWSSGRFTRPDDVARLAATIRAAEGRVGDLRDSMETLRRLTLADAALIPAAMEVVEAIAACRAAPAPVLPAEVLSGLLSAGLGEATTRDSAATLVHEFGEQGYLTLRSLLE